MRTGLCDITFNPSCDSSLGVLLLDSDVYVSCTDLHFSHGVWRSARDAAVGFFPRLHRWLRWIALAVWMRGKKNECECGGTALCDVFPMTNGSNECWKHNKLCQSVYSPCTPRAHPSRAILISDVIFSSLLFYRRSTLESGPGSAVGYELLGWSDILSKRAYSLMLPAGFFLHRKYINVSLMLCCLILSFLLLSCVFTITLADISRLSHAIFLNDYLSSFPFSYSMLVSSGAPISLLLSLIVRSVMPTLRSRVPQTWKRSRRRFFWGNTWLRTHCVRTLRYRSTPLPCPVCLLSSWMCVSP